MNIEDVAVGETYRNLKTGGHYTVLHLAQNSESPAETLVVYRHVGLTAVWARPLALFAQKFVPRTP